MKKIGFINSQSALHAVRGVGFYTRRLIPPLKQLAGKFDMEISEISGFDDHPERFGLIHQPYFDLFKPTLPLFPPTPSIITIHDIIPLEFPNHYPPGIKANIGLFWQKLALHNVSRVITDSYASLGQIRRYLHVPHSRLKFIYLAAGAEFKPEKRRSQLTKTKAKYHLPDKFILNVGDVNYNKNIPTLVNTCLSLKIPLVLVGKQVKEIEKLNLSHPELSHLSSLISHIAPPLIIRPGFIPDSELVDIYNLASVYVQPSYAEGFGLPVLEAMACGTPVICSRTHSLPEVAGDAALYFDPHSSDQLSLQINKLLTQQKLRHRLIRAGLDQAAKFSWEQAARQTLQVYAQVL